MIIDNHKILTDSRFSTLPSDYRRVFQLLTIVFPFRVNEYILDMIDWGSKVMDDPIFRLYFPMPEMLATSTLNELRQTVGAGATADELADLSNRIRESFNPQPAGQLTDNVPQLNGKRVAGVQRKYLETALVFPTSGQQCYSFCAYCFRAPQFPVSVAAGKQAHLPDDMRFMAPVDGEWEEFIARETSLTDVLLTGGEVLFTKASLLEPYIEKLLNIPHIKNIRFGAKVLSHWPEALANGRGADERIKLIEKIARAGKNPAFMAHFSHPRELASDTVKAAIRRIIDAGAVIRSQAPIMKGVNDDAGIWADLWRESTNLGIVPYYMFASRDTGADKYWSVPLMRASAIFREAQSRVCGLARTARLSMSAQPGKIGVDGVAEIGDREVLCLRMLQARDPELVGRPFFAQADSKAVWIDELKPAFSKRWPWEKQPDSEALAARIAALTPVASGT